MKPLRPIVPGGPLYAEDENAKAAELLRLGKFTVDGGDLTTDGTGVHLVIPPRAEEGFWARIDGGENPYAWTEMIPHGDGAGTWTERVGGRTSTLDSGTATSGGATTLTDSGQSWTTNEWAGKQVMIVAGTGAGQIRAIESNAADEITVSVAWTTNPDTDTDYVITDAPAYEENGVDSVLGDTIVWMRRGMATVSGTTLVQEYLFSAREGSVTAASITVKEADGSPAYTDIHTLEIAANGALSNPSSGVARLLDASTTGGGLITNTPQTLKGNKTLQGNLILGRDAGYYFSLAVDSIHRESRIYGADSSPSEIYDRDGTAKGSEKMIGIRVQGLDDGTEVYSYLSADVVNVVGVRFDGLGEDVRVALVEDFFGTVDTITNSDFAEYKSHCNNWPIANWNDTAGGRITWPVPQTLLMDHCWTICRAMSVWGTVSSPDGHFYRNSHFSAGQHRWAGSEWGHIPASMDAGSNESNAPVIKSDIATIGTGISPEPEGPYTVKLHYPGLTHSEVTIVNLLTENDLEVYTHVPTVDPDTESVPIASIHGSATPYLIPPQKAVTFRSAPTGGTISPPPSSVYKVTWFPAEAIDSASLFAPNPIVDGINSLDSPDEDAILFWDDSEEAVAWLTIGEGLAITETVLHVQAPIPVATTSAPSVTTDKAWIHAADFASVDGAAGVRITDETTVDAVHLGKISRFFRGDTVASASTIAPSGNVFAVSGTTDISTITASGVEPGTEITLLFADTLTLLNDGNIELAGGPLVTIAGLAVQLTWDGTKWRGTNWPRMISQIFDKTFTFDARPDVLQDDRIDWVVPVNCTIEEWYIKADEVGDIEFDIETTDFFEAAPFASITDTTPPVLSAADRAAGGVSGWTTGLPLYNLLRVKISNITSITRVTLVLIFRRTW